MVSLKYQIRENKDARRPSYSWKLFENAVKINKKKICIEIKYIEMQTFL